MSVDFGGNNENSHVWADFDNDGDLDLLINAGPPNEQVLRIYENRGAGQFVAREPVDTGFGRTYAVVTVVADFDRDGRLDVATFGVERQEGLYRTVLWRNEGNLSFSRWPAPLYDSWQGHLAWGDVDGDGDLDLAQEGVDSQVRILENSGDGHFTPSTHWKTGLNSVAGWVDFDRDGDVDLVSRGMNLPILVDRNDAMRGMTTLEFIPSVAWSGPFGMAWADFDGDGDLDFAAQSQGGYARLFRNDGGLALTGLPDAIAPSNTYSIQWGDPDNDGDLDLLLSTGTNGERPATTGANILINDGAGHFTLAGLAITTGDDGRCSWADYDNDGDLDFLFQGGCNSSVGCPGTRLYRNDDPVANTPPAAPTGLKAELQPDGAIRLGWNAATDAQTRNSALLTYDIRVGIKPGGSDVVCPPADPVTGWRRVVAFGAERATFRCLRNLPKGAYHWSVQAVDTGLAGSAWAVEGQFTVTNTPPVFSDVAAQVLHPSQVAEVPFAVSDAESAATDITVTVVSSDPALFPADRITVSNSGNSRVVRLQPAAGLTGSAWISLEARDPKGLTTQTRFAVTVVQFELEPPLEAPDVVTVMLANLPPADYDGDGDLDVFFNGLRRLADQQIVWFSGLAVNDGSGRFSLAPQLQVPESSAVADFDRDGDLDAIIQSGFFENDGNGQMIARPLNLLWHWSDVPLVGDLDGDGDTDLVLQGYPTPNGSRQVCVVVRNEGGRFRADRPLFEFDVFTVAALEDFDGDGDLDLFAGFFLDEGPPFRRFSKLFLNDGDGRFGVSRDVEPAVALGWGGEPWFDDDDDDGDLDVVQFRHDTGDYFRLANDGTGKFTLEPRPRRYSRPAGDLNNDGNTDAFIQVAETGPLYGKYLLQYRTPNGSFTPQVLALNTPPAPFIGDFDGDGDLDMLINAPSSNPNGGQAFQMQLIRNHSDQTNRPPAAPVARADAHLEGSRIRLEWTAPADDHTPTRLLSYQLRVGTRPGDGDVMSTGSRRAAPGNAGRANHYDFYSLPAGRYYWSVRALDGQFREGPWSAERTFVVDRAGIAPIADVTTPPFEFCRPIVIRLTGDATTPAGNLVLTAESEDPALIPATAIVLAGTGAVRTLSLRPELGQGEANITVRATDAAGIATSIRFHVTVSQFITRELGLGGPSSDNLRWMDWDSDGRLDLVGLGSTAGTLAGWRNSGGGQLEPAALDLPGIQASRLLMGDADGDNRPDLAVIESTQDMLGGPFSSVQLWRNQGGAQFAALSARMTNSAMTAAYDKDLNGMADFVLWSPRAGTQLSPWLTGGLPDGMRLSAPDRMLRDIVGFVWTDLEGDGDLDLLVSGYEYSPLENRGTTFLRAWKRQGDGTMEPFETGLPKTLWSRLAVADLTGDGWPDLFTGPLDAVNGGGPRLWRNHGDGTFEELQSGFPPLLNGPPAWADYDNDGDPDFVTTSATELANVNDPASRSMLWRNDGAGHFEALNQMLPPMLNSDATWADADGDGDLDLAVGGAVTWASAGRRLLLNTALRSNTPPTAPPGLEARREPDGLVLTWQAGTDLEDPRFLTYNLRIGTTPGGSEILSAVADPVSGQRRLGGPGNMEGGRRWRLPELPNATYYWSVQSVDSGYAASAFAPEQSFRVSRPIIAGPTTLSLGPNRPAGPFAFTITDADTAPSQIRTRLQSDSDILLTSADFQWVRNGSQWMLTLTPARHRAGSAMVEIEATDAAGEMSRFRVSVTVAEEFAAVPIPIPPTLQGVALWVDADNDGWMDLVAGGFTNMPYTEGAGECRLWRNTGGSFAVSPIASFTDAGDGVVAAADGDGDNAVDFLVAGGVGGARVYWQSSPGLFGPTTALAKAARSLGGWGDADGDGDMDLLVSGLGESSWIGYNRLQLLRNYGGRNLSEDLTRWDAFRDGQAQWADFDGDGDADLLLTGSKGIGAGDAATSLFFNTAGGLIAASTGLDRAHAVSAAVADYDLDGDPDILLAGMLVRSNVMEIGTRLYANDGTGQFTPVESSFTGIVAGGASWGEFDGDGDPDLLISGRTTSGFTTELWSNDGDHFTRTSNQFAGLAARGVAWGDYDQDGDLDLALIGHPEGFVTPDPGPPVAAVFRNGVNVTAAPPPPPVNLAAEADGNDILLSWRLPNGAPRGLSFNVRVGSSPGASDVMSALADPATGRRLLAANGNAGWSGKWRLVGQAGRTLYWSVQSISPAYQPSPFAPEESFFFTRNERPYVNPAGDISSAMNAAIPPVEIGFGDADDPAATLELSAISSNPTLFPDNAMSITRRDNQFRLELRPPANVAGASRITVTVRDPKGSKAETSFFVVVRAFTEFEAGLAPMVPEVIQTGDIEGDGDSDLLASGWRVDWGWAPFAEILVNQGKDAFTELSAPGLELGGGDAAVDWADWDVDGDFDVLAAGSAGRNLGGQFTHTVLPGADKRARPAWGDLDGDGDLDLALPGGSNRELGIFQNEAGNWIVLNPGLTPVSDGCAAWGDADNDGDLDLAVSGRELESLQAFPILRLYRNDHGKLTEVLRLIGIFNGRLQWADVNGDGRADLLMAGFHPDETRERLLLNLGGWRFHSVDLGATNPGVEPFPGALLADFDNDGDADLAEYTASATWLIRLNNGSGAFARGVWASFNVPTAVLAAADWDGDGNLDIASGGAARPGFTKFGWLRLYHNHRIDLDPDPPAPRETVSGNDVLLEWPRYKDSMTGAILTANLRVGRTPDSGDVLSPLSLPSSGQRQVAAPGNAGFARRTRLRGLSPGTYRWSLQSVDAGHHGSAWSPERVFTIQANLPAGRLTAEPGTTPSSIRCNVQSPGGYLALIESSPDLIHWTVIKTERVGTDGRAMVEFNRNDSQAFFRVTAVP